MKKMTFALACASTLALFAETTTWSSSTGFDGSADNEPFNDEVAANGALWTRPTDDNSAVTAYNNDAPAAGSSLSGQPGDNYLKLDTNGGELTRKFAAEGSHTVPSTGTYIDTMVQFTATEDDNEDGPTLVGDEKLAIWLKATGDDANKTYTLCVKAGGLSADGIKGVVVYDLQGNFSPETWYRLTVKMIDDVYVPNDYYKSAAFEIRIDGNLVTSSTPSIEATWAASLVQAEVLSSEMKAKVDGGELFLSLEQGTPGTASSLTSVGFKGSGAIDELVLTDEDLFPEQSAPTVVPVTSVTLDITSTNVTVGTEFALVATVVPENATSQTVTWEVTKGDAVTVVNGTVKAVQVGTAKVTATVGDKSATCTVTVTAAASYPTYIGEDTAKQAKYNAWVKAYGVSDTGSAYMDAFLLNCAPANVDTAKAAFKIVSIEQDAQGAWVAKVTDNTGDGEAFGNGYVVIKGSATVNGTYNLATTDGTARFFKAFLVLDAPAAK